MTRFDKHNKRIVSDIVRHVVLKDGGYREKSILAAPHAFEKSETWNADHKVVNVLETMPDLDGYRAGFAVDIVTRSIVG